MVRGSEQYYSKTFHPALSLFWCIDRHLGIHHDFDRRREELRRVVGHAAAVGYIRVSEDAFPH